LKRLKLSRRRIRSHPRAATQKRWNRLKNKGSAVFFTKKADISAGLPHIRAKLASLVRAEAPPVPSGT
jgi:hypothetical protein